MSSVNPRPRSGPPQVATQPTIGGSEAAPGASAPDHPDPPRAAAQPGTEAVDLRAARQRQNIWRTTAFRVTLLHLVLTLLGTLALSAVAWWATTRFALQHLAEEVERDTAVLLQSARLGGQA